VLFVTGTGAALWRATGRAPIARGLLPVLGAAALIAFGQVPAVAMALLTATLVALALVERRGFV
jgi:hypothetical protein